MKKILSVIILVTTLTATTSFAENYIRNSAVFGNNNYRLFDVTLISWEQAKIASERLGGHLVTIESASEQKFIENLLSGGSRNSYWIGGYKTSNGRWMWVTNRALSYTNWANGQPDNWTGREDKLMIYRNSNPMNPSPRGKWNDIQADADCNGESFFGYENFGYICEWEGTANQKTDNTKQRYLQKYQIAKRYIAQVQNSYMQAMQSKIKTSQKVNPEDSGALERLTQEIWKVNPRVDEEYCKAFALAILEDVESFNKNHNSQKTYNIFTQRGLNDFFNDFIQTINKNVSVNGRKFYCRGTSYYGMYSNITIRKQNTGKAVTLSWVKNDNEVKKICADYFERLKAINSDAWENFRKALRDDLRELLGKGSLLNESVIRALCDSEVSQAAMKDVLATFKNFTEIELGNESFRDYMNDGYKITQIWNTFKKDFRSTVENGVNDGSDFIKSAEKIKIAQEKLQAFKDVLDRNSSGSGIEKAWEDFKSAYEVVGGSGIFGNKNDLIPIPQLED